MVSSAAEKEPRALEEPAVPTRRRRVLVYGIIVLAAVIALTASLTVWVKRQVLDTEAWTEASSRLLQNDEIRNALSIRLADALFEARNVEANLQERLPPEFAGLAPALATAIQDRAVPVAERLLSSPRAQSLWVEINRRAHTRLIQVLEGNEGGTITTTGGDVVLDLQPLLEQLAARLGLSTELQPGVGQITIMRPDQLDSFQTAVRVLKAVTVFLGLVVLALLALALYLARGFRRQALRAAGAGLLLVGLLLLVARRLAGEYIVDQLTSAATEPAGGAAWLIATDLLGAVGVLLVVYGALAVIGAWLAGPTRPAVWFRRTIAPVLQRSPALAYAAVLLVFLLILVWGPTGSPTRLVGILIVGGLLALGVWALRRQTLREFPVPEDASVVVAAPPPVLGAGNRETPD